MDWYILFRRSILNYLFSVYSAKVRDIISKSEDNGKNFPMSLLSFRSKMLFMFLKFEPQSNEDAS